MPAARTRLFCLLVLTPLLGACEGQLLVDISAAPVAGAQRVQLAVSSIELLESDGGITSIDPDQTDAFNLLAYTGGDTLRLLDADGDVSGSYIGLRLRFDDADAYLRDDNGVSVPIELLADGEYANLSFDLDDSSSVALIAEIDLRFSLIDGVADLGVYQLLPVMRVVDADRYASIEGGIAAAQVEDNDCRNGRSAGSGVVIYLFEGNDVTPADYYDSGTAVNLNQPIASAAVVEDDAGVWRFSVAFIAPGDYTVAWTCEGDAEQPREDDGLLFQASANLSVDEAQIASVEF